MPEMTVELRELAALHLDDANARRHTAANLAAIRRSLERFGQQRPLVVAPDGRIIAGNGTYEAAAELGWEVVAVTVFDGTDEDARAFAIADNRTAELAAWNYELLYDQLTGLGEQIDWTGFSAADLDDLAARLEEAEPEGAGIRSTPSIGEYAERYATRATRLLIMEYQAEVYGWVASRLEEVREELGITSNAEVLIRMLAERSGKKAPKLVIE
jgi:ParB-like chromosome segregation protein Spo0J